MKQEIDKMKEIINSTKNENSNIESSLQKMSEENQKLKVELQSKIDQQNELVIHLQKTQTKEQVKKIRSNGTNIGFTDNYGIIHSLQQNSSNKIILSCSELHSGPIKNVLTLDDNGWWSTNKLNSLISIQFQKTKFQFLDIYFEHMELLI
jgi:regulator of replication initiation timing